MSALGIGAETLKVKSGLLCLDFANTVEWHASDHPGENLNHYSDLVDWAKRVGLLNDRQAQRLLKVAAQHPVQAASVLKRAIDLREALYRMLADVAHARSPQPADLAIVNGELAGTLDRLQLARSDEGFSWSWIEEDDALDRMLWPIVRSVADVLTSSEQLHRIGQCADDRGCGWLFLDTSKNHSRRWCDMRDCGNRAKAQRYYARQKEA
jgi:predicted RNA-binding Zn ribbon-like protein